MTTPTPTTSTPPPPKKKIQKNPIVFFELKSSNEESSKRLVFELYGDVVPRTVENFLQIARGDVDDLKYADTILEVREDGLYGSAKGSPERSVFGSGRFMNESFSGKAGKHAGFGTLYCYNEGKKGNATGFHVSMSEKNGSKEGQCVVMGKMIEGHDFLRKLATLKTVRVEKCGEQRLASSLVCPREPFRIYCEENKSVEMKDLANTWRTQMSQEQKNVYVEKARKERDVYDAEVERLKEIERAEMESRSKMVGLRKRGRKRKKSKIGSTAFNFFCLEKQKTIKEKENLEDSEVSKTLTEMWEKMDGNARLPYIEMERKAKEERQRQHMKEKAARKRQRLNDLYPLDATVEFLQDNPKQPTSMSYARYEKYKAAKTIEEYFQLGGTRGDIKYDTARGYMRILKTKEEEHKKTEVEENTVVEATPTPSFMVATT